MIKNFVHKGLEDLYTTGKSRRVKADFIPRCILILQALDIAEDVTEMNIVTFAFHGL